ncbi:MAG: hypothetical protein MJB14_01640 [Spirochaetes bacterium]|nr:hypothetical protein [Spirochaetota bacterium]
MHKKIGFILILLLICSVLPVMSQDTTTQEDKYSTVNVMIQRITDCRLGVIVEYYYGVKLIRSYFPNHFFSKKWAVKVVENDTHISPQMNIIYKNFKPLRVKLYLQTNVSSPTYRYLEYVSPEIEEKFKNAKMEFVFD